MRAFQGLMPGKETQPMTVLPSALSVGLLAQSSLQSPGQGGNEVETQQLCLVWDRLKHFIPKALFVISPLL